MLGHEFAKLAVKEYLEAALPPKLYEIHQRLESSWPPAVETYLLDDEIDPDTMQLPGMFPALLIRTAKISDITQISARRDDFEITYDVMVTTLVAAQHGRDFGSAALGRDRIMLAIRELLFRPQIKVPEILVHSGYSEETGPATFSLQGAPLAAGEIGFEVRVAESIELPGVEATDADITITPIEE